MKLSRLFLLIPVAVLIMGADLASDVIAGKPTVPSLCMVKASDGRVYPCSGTDGGSLQTINAGSSTSAPAETISTVVGNVTACTAVGGASCSIIYPSTDWGSVPNLSIAITNLGAAVIDNVLVEWSPIADGGGFELWDSTMFASLAASTTKSVAISGNSRRFLRIESRAAADGGPVHVTVTGNQN